MVELKEIVEKLDVEFAIASFGKDASFSRFIPMVYDPLNFDWKSAFEKDFVKFFNGLMLKGAPTVEKIFLAVFPTDYVLERFIEESRSGDLLFMHSSPFDGVRRPKGQMGARVSTH